MASFAVSLLLIRLIYAAHFPTQVLSEVDGDLGVKTESPGRLPEQWFGGPPAILGSVVTTLIVVSRCTLRLKWLISRDRSTLIYLEERTRLNQQGSRKNPIENPSISPSQVEDAATTPCIGAPARVSHPVLIPRGKNT
jgi:hypothetical protein